MSQPGHLEGCEAKEMAGEKRLRRKHGTDLGGLLANTKQPYFIIII